MDLIVFYKLNNHLLLIGRDIEQEQRYFIPEAKFKKYKKGIKYSGTGLNQTFGDLFRHKYSYKFYTKDRHVFFYASNFFLDLLLTDKDKKPFFWSNLAGNLIYQFRHDQKETLLSKITKSTNIDDYLKILSDYIFCEHYSLWSYNKKTSVFICESSSFSNKYNDFIESEPRNGLSKVIEEGYIGYESRAINKKYHRADLLAKHGIKSVNRIKLCIGRNNKTIAVVNFYSKMDDFFINEDTSIRLKSLVEGKYIEAVRRSDERLHELSHIAALDIQNQSLDDYLCKFVGGICKIFQYEACSIFVIDGRKLKLRATCDYKEHGKRDDIYYLVNRPSMTTNILRSKKTHCCYKLDDDKNNSHGYDEKTEHKGCNWVGIPIIGKARKVIGVVRVKNKFTKDQDTKKICQPRSIDLDILEKAVLILTASIDIFTQYDELNGKLQNQNDFNRVLLHEIRTPISTINAGPGLIEIMLENESINFDRKKKILKLLGDIKVLGGRLKMITDSYNFQNIVSLKQNDVLSLLQDVVYPVTNITKPYHEHQHNCNVDVNQSTLHSWKVIGDKTLYGMALNALLDNAAKYCSTEDRTIQIYASYKYGDDVLKLSVRNKGFPIREEEKELIFNEGYRSPQAIDEKIHGTGIGLYLAHTIMKESGGDLYLEHHQDKSDIEFVMVIPAVTPENFQ